MSRSWKRESTSADEISEPERSPVKGESSPPSTRSKEDTQLPSRQHFSPDFFIVHQTVDAQPQKIRQDHQTTRNPAHQEAKQKPNDTKSSDQTSTRFGMEEKPTNRMPPEMKPK